MTVLFSGRGRLLYRVEGLPDSYRTREPATAASASVGDRCTRPAAIAASSLLRPLAVWIAPILFWVLGALCSVLPVPPLIRFVCVLLCVLSGPTTVLISSLMFIGSVVVLHIWGKISS